jgi:hypothetical protein
MTMVSPIQGVIPLPKPRPRMHQNRRKTGSALHLPFMLSR